MEAATVGSTKTMLLDATSDNERAAKDWMATRRDAELALQFDIYVSGSTNVARICGRATLLRNMFLEMECLRIDVTHLSEWDAALWTRSRVSSGTKTAGALARSALTLAERFTGEMFYATSSLVKCQAGPKHGERAASEPAKPAAPLEWNHIKALESAMDTGATPQQRIMAGYFVFLVHTSHRCSNGQRTRRMELTADALMGESLLKGRKSWTTWAASRQGFTVKDWAGPWLDQLAEEGLPGEDFVVWAPNVTLDAWLPRPAEYSDFNRALHLLLMVYAGESPQSVVSYTPHGCRHVAVTAATQLVAQGILTDSSLEYLGHWEKGSKMTRIYDAQARVTELQTRKTVADAIRGGWRPSIAGNLPTPATPALIRMSSSSGVTWGLTDAACGQPPSLPKPHRRSPSPVRVRTVYNTHRKMLHLVVPPKKVSKCNFWTCGSAEEPAWNANFTITSGRQCTKCFMG